jgi:hypothetical protein
MSLAVEPPAKARPDVNGGRFTSRRGNAAVCRSAATARFIASQDWTIGTSSVTDGILPSCGRSFSGERPGRHELQVAVNANIAKLPL